MSVTRAQSESGAESLVSEDVLSIVKSLKEASRDLPKNTKNIETLVEGLKRLQEAQSSGAVKEPKLRRKLASLCNLMSQVQPQLERARKLAERRGLRYYISRAKGKVLGNDVSNAVSRMETEIQSWLDVQSMENLVKVLESQESGEEEKVDSLALFEARVKEGYDPELQDVLLSLRVFDALTGVFEKCECPRVKKEAAFALAALVHFNKDVFVSQVLMSGVVESLLAMVRKGESDLAIGAVSVIGSLVSAGKGAVVDEIHSRGGVKSIVRLLEDEREEMKVAAMECVFEMAYFARKEAVEAMLEEDVVKKLARLQHSQAGGDIVDLPMQLKKSSSSSLVYQASQSDSVPAAVNSPESRHDVLLRKNSDECLAKLMEDEAKRISTSRKSTDSSQGCVESIKSGDEKHYSAVEEYWMNHPFASAVARFAIQLEIGQGLRQREKRALKQEILKRVREAVPYDAEVASIFAEVLWGP